MNNALLVGNSRMAMIPVQGLNGFQFFNAGLGGGNAEEARLRLSLWTRRYEATGPLPGTDDTVRLTAGTIPLLAGALRQDGGKLDLPFLSLGPLTPWAEALRQQAHREGVPIRHLLRSLLPPLLVEALGQREAAPLVVNRDALLDGQRDRVLDRLAMTRGGPLAALLDLDRAERRTRDHYDHQAPNAVLVWRLFLLATWYATA